uniref:RZ-type domain-containing protein n=1 Tax=Ciona savignyi TaxID=51511 RepID=H2YBP2_CIOSA
CTKGHRCKKKCSDDCGNCMEKVEKMVPMCCHIEKMPCYKDPAEHTCTKPCSKILSCEHTCSNVCGVNCVTECLEKVTVNLACGHESKVVCHLSKDPDKSLCTEQCNEQLQCGHLCKGTCSKCMQGRLHEKCGKKCTRTLFCGHPCRESCSVNCPPCTRPCETRCEHSKCKKNCLEPCTLCTEKCEWRCAHFKCGKLCSEPCDRPPCNEPCDKVLKCTHVCIGLCGEPCPKLCRDCDKEKVTEIFFGDEDETDARFVELPECGHVFTYEGLDKWMGMHQDDKSDDGEDANIQLKKCPRCSTPIRGARRYGEIINDQLKAINKVKERSHGTKSEIASATRALSAKINGKEGNECHFKDDIAGLRKRLESKPKSMSALKVIEHQYSGLCALSAVQIKIKKYIQIAGGMLRDDISHIHSWLMKPRSRFSEQEIEDFAKEEKRIRQGYFFVVILNNFNKNKLNLSNKFKKIIHKMGIFILKDLYQVIRVIKIVKKSLLENGKMSKSEREMIVKAMGLSKGHWYKCKKGHIYCIADCGGATVQGVCPECKGVIGGSGHRLHKDNAVATEMDGATRPAYDPMNNYIPPED